MRVELLTDYGNFSEGTVGYSSLVEWRMATNLIDRFWLFRGNNKDGDYCIQEIPKRLLKVLGDDDNEFQASLNKKEILEDVKRREHFIRVINDPWVDIHLVMQDSFGGAVAYLGLNLNNNWHVYADVLKSSSQGTAAISDTAQVYLSEEHKEHLVLALEGTGYRMYAVCCSEDSKLNSLDETYYSNVNDAIKGIYNVFKPTF